VEVVGKCQTSRLERRMKVEMLVVIVVNVALVATKKIESSVKYSYEN
jgi:hypothetical protein